MTSQDINYINLLLGVSLVLLPFALLYYFRVKLILASLMGVVRMIIQLSLIALYLEFIFDLNAAWLNLLWLIIMVFAGVGTQIKRLNLNWRYFLLPMLISWFFALIIVDSMFLGVVLDLDYKFDARYLIPITGMLLGNALNYNIISMNSYLKGLQNQTNLYEFILINTGNKKSALRPFMQQAISDGANPLIASISIIGLISLPGMMTGQILAGQSPLVAIKYQLMVMIGIYATSTISLILSIILTNYFLFDSYSNLKKDIIKQKPV